MSGSPKEELEAQQERVEELFDQVSKPELDRPAVLHNLLRELAVLVATERAEVQPLVKSRSIGGDDLADKLKDDYDQIDRLMVLIERRKFNSPDVPGMVTELMDIINAHVERCEKELYPGLDSALSAEERDELAGRIKQAGDMVSTHPHPHLLSWTPISDKLTALLAHFDWARDKTVTNLPPKADEGSGTEEPGQPEQADDGDPSMGGAV